MEDRGPQALLPRHRVDDRLEPPKIRLLAAQVRRRPAQRLAEGEHSEELVERTHAAELPELLAEVLERERLLTDLPDELLGLLGGHRLLGSLDERQHVPHADEAGGETGGVGDTERVDLLPPPPAGGEAAGGVPWR